ncbi:MAG: ribonuclease E/G [Pseudomonadota bacterium]
MKGRQIVIERAPNGRTRAALTLDGRLDDLLIDPLPGEVAPAPEAIYAARVERLVPGMGAAFVRLDAEHTGFLREAKGVREGERLLVQVISFAEAGKAVPVTRRLLHKTRTVIATPSAPGINVSRQIRDEAERARLIGVAEAALAKTHPKDPPGLILRSLAEGAEAETLRADLQEALAAASLHWQEPGLVRPAPDAAALAQREWAGPVSEAGFDAHGLLDALDTLATPNAALPSGGWIAVEPTRALTAVDVNTAGAFAGAAALTANLEAARETLRQLRLRGLGGVVAIDFAPLAKKDRRRLEEALKSSVKRDPVETSLAGWTPLGLFELQRKRERRPTAGLL